MSTTTTCDCGSTSPSSSSDILLALVAITVLSSIGSLIFNVVQAWEFLRKYFSRKAPEFKPHEDVANLFGPPDRRLLADVWARIMNEGANSLWHLPSALLAKIDYVYNFARRQTQADQYARRIRSHMGPRMESLFDSSATSSVHGAATANMLLFRKRPKPSIRKAKTFACDEHPISTIRPHTSFQDDLEVGLEQVSSLPIPAKSKRKKEKGLLYELNKRTGVVEQQQQQQQQQHRQREEEEEIVQSLSEDESSSSSSKDSSSPEPLDSAAEEEESSS